MSPVHHESAFGDAIVAAMTERGGWREARPEGYSPELGLDTGELAAFINATQGDEWSELVDTQFPGDPDAAQRAFAQRIDTAIATTGVLDVLRNGVKFLGTRFYLAYFKPNLVADDSILDDYRANRLAVVRELPYATKPSGRGKRLDLALFLNGIPVATGELKNPLTGQGVEQAKEQYRTDRDPTEPIFTRRSVANFAIDPDLVFVAPQLRGKNTRFLPFNTGSEGPGRPGGAGNPAPDTPGTYATSYLWEKVWQRDNWLDLLHRFVHAHKSKTPGGSTSTSLIFPRYHQWDAVKKLTAHSATHGPGHDYLIMASAGSGKSNTIGWLAHRLSDLHTPTNVADLDQEAVAKGLKPGVPVFDKVIVITDRRNLDTQLRKTVSNFEQTKGLVVPVDERHGAKSAQLARALSRDTGKIVTVTLHSFPALLDYIQRNPTEIRGSTFAVVIDEAHSSQSGDAAVAVRATLRELGLDSDSDDEGAAALTVTEQLKKKAEDRSRAANLSYFAFTATPKSKTLQLFGTLDDSHGGEASYRPFHTYSMRQAIEEGFILDPLRNYVTYNTYWKLVNKNPEEKEVDPSKAKTHLARYALTHASTVSQHATVIVEHFLAHTRGRLGGRAKAMVVTASRKSAVQTARAIKSYIADREYNTRYPDLGVLVAISGSLTLDGEETTEVKENGGLSESAVPKAFAYTRADDKSVRAGGLGQQEYRILVVAEKYQTGFDQPLLTTMYVNKTLLGVSAVQTLSRLNRTHDRKSQADLAVMDFVNDAEDIRNAFIPYFEEADTLPSDPNLLYTAQSRVMEPPILSEREMDGFAASYLAAKEKAGGSHTKWEKLHAELFRLLSPAVLRFEDLRDSKDEDDQEAAESFRADLVDYVRKYGFLAQIVPYHDPELERLHLYGRYLLTRLRPGADGAVDIGEVDLSHLRVEKTGEHDLSLSPEGTSTLKGFGDGVGSAKEKEKSPLSEVIDKLYAKYGTEFTERDVLIPYQEAMADTRVRAAAYANKDVDNFGHVFDPVLEEKIADHVDTVTHLGNRYFGQDQSFKSDINRRLRRAAWRMIRQEEGWDDAA